MLHEKKHFVGNRLTLNGHSFRDCIFEDCELTVWRFGEGADLAGVNEIKSNCVLKGDGWPLDIVREIKNKQIASYLAQFTPTTETKQ